jgi:hypothetical protein
MITPSEAEMLMGALVGRYYMAGAFTRAKRAGRKKTLARLLKAGLLHPLTPGRRVHLPTIAGIDAVRLWKLGAGSRASEIGVRSSEEHGNRASEIEVRSSCVEKGGGA